MKSFYASVRARYIGCGTSFVVDLKRVHVREYGRFEAGSLNWDQFSGEHLFYMYMYEYSSHDVRILHTEWKGFR